MKNLLQLKQLSSPLSVLYIEDNLDLQKKFSIHLDQFFAKVYQAYDALEGLEKYRRYKPEIIITDLTLSKQNSFAMIMEIQHINEDVHIIVLSQRDDNFILLESLDVHNLQLLEKPLDFPIFHKALMQVLLKDFKTKKDDQCTLLLEEIFQKKEPIACLNTYKGVSISHTAHLLIFENGCLKIRVSPAQLVAALHEKATIIEYQNKYIHCQLSDINRTALILTLNNPCIIQYNKRSLANKRIETDQSFKSSISSQSINFEVTPITISFKFFTLLNTHRIELQKGEMVNLSLGFDIDAPSSLIKEKKFTKIFAKGEVMRVDNTVHGQHVVVKLMIKKAGESFFKRYLQQREIAIIKEFKARIQSAKHHE